MNLKEHNDNRFTKERDEVEKYLLRIIQRYFDIENNYTKESIEAMILESLTRFKQIIVSEAGFIFSLNKMTGKLTLSIRDFDGEPAFDKRTAFNKNFGDIENTICEGDDPRLYDDREPLTHVHVIDDINGLREELEKVVWPESGSNHTHKNMDVLDIIRYTGTQTQIDLIMLEHLAKAIEEHCKKFNGYKQELAVIQRNGLERLQNCIPQLEQIVLNAKELTDNAITWLPDAYAYTNSKVETWKIDILKHLLSYITKEQGQVLINSLKKAYDKMSDGEIPLQDGTVSFVPVQEESITEAGSGQGDSLWRIYQEGLRLGYDDWQWDDVNQSFVYQSNEMYSYPMFISINKFDTYTHRVTLQSQAPDNDCISVVIAYDEETGSHLSLTVTQGDVLASGQTGANATVILNFDGGSQGHSLTGDYIVDYVQLANNDNYWNTLTHGITALVKRDKNNIKIWVLYNAEHSWLPTEQDGRKDIYPDEEPTFEFNLTDYTSLQPFVDKKCNYGYGCFSQPLATYADVYFLSQIIYDEPYGHTNISEISTTTYDVSRQLQYANKGRIKLYFRYDKDGKTITAPLPFHYKNGDIDTVIQGTYTEDGLLTITSNMMHVLQLYVTNANLYDKDTVITTNSVDVDQYYNMQQRAKQDGFDLCVIDSDAKNNFVANIIHPDIYYYINGERSYLDNQYYDSNGNVLSYFNWTTGHPLTTDEDTNIAIINGLWESVDSVQHIGFVAEYKIKRLTQYFNNPRIYYEILGTQEVV